MQSDQNSFLAGSQGKNWTVILTVALQNPNPINDMPYNLFASFEVALVDQNDNQTSSTETMAGVIAKLTLFHQRWLELSFDHNV